MHNLPMKQLSRNRLPEVIAVFLLVFIILLLRRPDAFTNPQLWAEDGKIFLQQNEQYGIKALTMPYAGYLHLVPRLVAFLFGALSINYLYIPLCYNAAAFLITLFSAFTFLKSADRMGMRNRILYAIIFVAVPVSGELFMNLTNTIWIAGLWLVNYLFAGRNRQYNIWLALILLIFSLTGPFSLILSPLCAFILFRERKTISRKQAAPLLIIITGGIVQLCFIMQSTRGMNRAFPGAGEPYHLWQMVRYNITDILFARAAFLQRIPGTVTLAISLLAFILLMFALFYCYRKIAQANKYILLASLLLFVVTFIVSFWPMESHTLAFDVPRYYFIPYTCVAWILIIATDKIPQLKVSLVYATFFALQLKNMRYALPDYEWKKQVTEYRQGKRSEIGINPDGWIVVLPRATSH